MELEEARRDDEAEYGSTSSVGLAAEEAARLATLLLPTLPRGSWPIRIRELLLQLTAIIADACDENGRWNFSDTGPNVVARQLVNGNHDLLAW